MTQTLEAPPAAAPQNTPPPREAEPFAAIFNRNELAAALAALAPCVKSRGPIAFLSCVKLTAEADGVTLEATDRELWASRTVRQVQVESAGAMLVNYDDLRKSVAALSGQTVSVAVEGKNGGTVRVRGEDFCHTLEASAVSEFPPALKVGGEPAGTVAAAELARLIKQTDAARSDLAKLGSNRAMASFWVQATKDRLRFSASDGKRMHDASAGWAGKPLTTTVLPAQLLKAAAVMAGEEGDVAAFVTDGRASFSGDGWELSGPLVEGKPPPIDDIIPKDCPGKATAGREDLLRAFRQASALLDPEWPYLKATWDAKGLSLSGKQDLARGSAGTLPLKYAGDPITIGLNARDFVEALSAATGEEVTIGLTAPNRAVLIDGGPNFKGVTMPCNLQ